MSHTWMQWLRSRDGTMEDSLYVSKLAVRTFTPLFSRTTREEGIVTAWIGVPLVVFPS